MVVGSEASSVAVKRVMKDRTHRDRAREIDVARPPVIPAQPLAADVSLNPD